MNRTTDESDNGMTGATSAAHQLARRYRMLIAISLVWLWWALVPPTDAIELAVCLTVALVTGHSGSGVPVSTHPATGAAKQEPSAAASQTTPAPPAGSSPAAAAAAALVGDLKEGVIDGQVTQQAGQQLFQQLQQLLFPPPGQAAQQLQQQYSQLVQQYTQAKSQGDITGQAVTTLSGAIGALGTALGTL